MSGFGVETHAHAYLSRAGQNARSEVMMLMMTMMMMMMVMQMVIDET